MTTMQGNFAHADAAEQAKSALKQAGIADSRIRTWNILEGGSSNHNAGNAITTGAVVGGLVAGSAGLVAGAGLGTLLDGDDSAPHLPEPFGVRVVVDVEGDEAQIEAFLVAAGAANVYSGPTAR